MRIKSPRLTKLAGKLSAVVFWLIFRTLRKNIFTVEGASPYNASGERRFLFSVWHDSALLAAFGGRHTRTVALTSRHQDGTFVASVVGFVGVKSVRGSTGRSGRSAARELLDVAKTNDIVITPDGPRGPRRQLSKGIVFLASRTGSAIVPTAFACASAWEISGSWTTLTIPKPFSRVVFLAGAPVVVPAAADTENLDNYRQTVQSEMDRLQLIADEMIKQPAHQQLAAGMLNPGSNPSTDAESITALPA